MLKIKEGYKLKDGRVLSTEEMMAVNDFYKMACTQEYICEAFELNEEDAWIVANEVQECMKKGDDGMNEEKFAREFIEFHGFHSSVKQKGIRDDFIKLANEVPVNGEEKQPMWIKTRKWRVTALLKDLDEETGEPLDWSSFTSEFYCDTHEEAMLLQDKLLKGEDNYYGDYIESCEISDAPVEVELLNPKWTRTENNSEPKMRM